MPGTAAALPDGAAAGRLGDERRGHDAGAAVGLVQLPATASRSAEPLPQPDQVIEPPQLDQGDGRPPTEHSTGSRRPGDNTTPRGTTGPQGTAQGSSPASLSQTEANGRRRKRACQGTASRSEMTPGRQPGSSLTTRGETTQAPPSRSGARRGRPRAQHAGAGQWPALGRRKRLLTAALVAVARAWQWLSGAFLDVPGPWMTPSRAGKVAGLANWPPRCWWAGNASQWPCGSLAATWPVRWPPWPACASWASGTPATLVWREETARDEPAA